MLSFDFKVIAMLGSYVVILVSCYCTNLTVNGSVNAWITFFTSN